MGAKLPKGILLSGPPGCGKTLLARALAGECNCIFFYKSGSEFEEMYLGIGSSRIRKLFNTAKKYKKAIIFIDEIDSIGFKWKDSGFFHDFETLNQLLTELDGFKSEDEIIIIGATNNIKILDPALLRSGRFDKIININPPSK